MYECRSKLFKSIWTKYGCRCKMNKRTLTNMHDLSKSEVKQFIDSFDVLLTDCDGVLWLENQVYKGAPEVLNRMRELGKRVFFVTNNSTKFRDDLVLKAEKMGYICKRDEVMTTSYLAANYLKEKKFDKKVYVVGSTGITEELDLVNIKHLPIGPDDVSDDLGDYMDKIKLDPEVGAVIVGFDQYISYPKMIKAASYLNNPECHFIATNTDERFPSKNSDLVKPGSGAVVRAIETGAEREPFVMGKPFTYIADTIAKICKNEPKRTLMIGDRCNTDILLGTKCGYQTLLVLSGISKLEEVKKWKESSKKEEVELVPDFYIDKLADLMQFLN